MEWLVIRHSPFRFFYLNIGEYLENKRFVVEFYALIRKRVLGFSFYWERGYGLQFSVLNFNILKPIGDFYDESIFSS